jgi:hypothetical protein
MTYGLPDSIIVGTARRTTRYITKGKKGKRVSVKSLPGGQFRNFSEYWRYITTGKR